MIKLNLGCGNHILPKPWINVDSHDFKVEKGLNFVKADICHLPFDKEYADYVLCDNVLEHLSQEDVVMALYEIRRVLKKGGKAVIIVPNFTGIAEEWLNFAKHGRYEFLAHKHFSEIIFGNQMHEGEYHRSAFYPPQVNALLQAVGFHNFELLGLKAGASMDSLNGIDGIIAPAGHAIRNEMIIIKIQK
jgi:predicted SAM-dependent methyltransferase